MSVRRVMGTEVEYGISVPGQPGANPMVTSSQIVNAYGARPELNRGGRARWDYEEESPLRDARGFTYSGALYDPSEALADEDLGLANVILTNGARLYVDHAHPEYSTPEVTNPRDAVLWDKAGERVMAEAARRAATIPGSVPIHLYKHNTDNKGVSFGSHENYLMKRQTPFADIVQYLTPFFVTRQIVCGSGRVGMGQDGSQPGFQISQRADFFEVEVGLETTLKRPIINTRDEPHADADKYRRLHVIIGDANLSEISTYLKLGTTALILSMIEEKALTADLGIADPVADLKHVSHDPTLKHRVKLRDGRRLTALDLQWAFFERARAFVDRRGGGGEQTEGVLDRWESGLDRLRPGPRGCGHAPGGGGTRRAPAGVPGRGEPRRRASGASANLRNVEVGFSYHGWRRARMATRDTGGQSQSGKSRKDEEFDEGPGPEANPEVSDRVEKIGEDVDDLLDEIDSVLEENAEEFVRGYVQKGGQ